MSLRPIASVLAASAALLILSSPARTVRHVRCLFRTPVLRKGGGVMCRHGWAILRPAPAPTGAVRVDGISNTRAPGACISGHPSRDPSPLNPPPKAGRRPTLPAFGLGANSKGRVRSDIAISDGCCGHASPWLPSPSPITRRRWAAHGIGQGLKCSSLRLRRRTVRVCTSG